MPSPKIFEVHGPGADGGAHFLVMKNSQQPGAAFLAFFDQGHNRVAIPGIERGRGFVEKHHGVARHEGSSQVDALLFSAGKSRRWQAPEPRRNVQPLQHLRRLRVGNFRRHAPSSQGFGDDLKRRHARNHAKELAYVSERPAAQKKDISGRRGGNIHHAAVVAHVDAARLEQIIPEYQSEQATLSATGRTGEGHTFAGIELQLEILKDTHRLGRSRVQQKRLAHTAEVEQRKRVAMGSLIHVCRIEETRSCVCGC